MRDCEWNEEEQGEDGVDGGKGFSGEGSNSKNSTSHEFMSQQVRWIALRTSKPLRELLGDLISFGLCLFIRSPKNQMDIKSGSDKKISVRKVYWSDEKWWDERLVTHRPPIKNFKKKNRWNNSTSGWQKVALLKILNKSSRKHFKTVSTF